MTTLILVLALFQTAQDLYNSAATDFDAGRWAEAATKYESVLKEDTSHIPSRFNLELLTGFIALAALIQKDREVNAGLIDCSVLIQKRTISGDCSVGIA